MKSISKKIKISIVLLLVAGIGFLSTSFVDNYFELSKNLDIFATLFREVNIYYVDETKPGDLMKKGIDGMLESLDPYTNYIPESDIEDYRFMTTGQYGGIGSLIRKKGEYVVISEPYENYPAQKAGLRAGDVILEVDGKSVKNKNTDELSKMLKGQANTPVKLLLERDGEKKPFEKIITREEIKIKSVPYYGMLDGNIGYIRLTSFTEDAGKEVKEALLDLKDKQQAKAIVLDLRGNPGGLLNESVNISNLFVERGQEIVSTKGRVQEWQKSYKGLNAAVDVNIPLAVLVNSGSASASEIVSGSLQDLDRAIIVGQKTFGKGLVQQTRNLSYNSKLKVTTAKYYVPSGRCIQALDYSNRNDDGSVGRVPDSLITTFKTKNGRLVKDGGGILPDVITSPRRYSKISISLENKLFIFDYATKYYQTHPKIEAPKSFKLSDAEYEAFIASIANKEYDYTTKTDRLLKELKAAAESEKYYEPAAKEYELLKTKLMHNKKEDLITFKTEIKELLEQEIISRYYYQKGKLEWALSVDEEVRRAMELLNDKNKYNDILSGKLKLNETKENKDTSDDKDGNDDGNPTEDN